MVTSITVQGQSGASTITTPEGTLQMEAAVLPANANDATFTWSVTNGTGSASIDTSGLLTATTDGDVTVTATANDDSGVTGTAVINISNQIVTSINKQTNIHNLSIYPNPVSSQLSIDSDEKIEIIRIINVMGKIEKTFAPSNYTINVSDLANGIYFLQVKTDKALMNKKFIKE